MTSKFSIYLRMSDASHKLGGTGDLSNTIYKNLTKKKIFENFLNVFGTENLTVMADNVRPETIEFLKSKGVKNIESTSLGDLKSFRNVLNLAIERSESEDDIIYFCEDDYLHFPESERYIREGIELAQYVTLYDSLDKYKDSDKGGYNPYISNGGEITRVILGKSCHWKYTNATTNTYAATVKTLREDFNIIMHYCSDQYPHPMDFLLFTDLIRNHGRILVTCIPGRSGHVGLEMPPFMNWNSLFEVE